MTSHSSPQNTNFWIEKLFIADQFIDAEVGIKHPSLDPETDKLYKFLDACPETEVLEQFLDPETDIVDESNFFTKKSQFFCFSKNFAICQSSIF